MKYLNKLTPLALALGLAAGAAQAVTINGGLVAGNNVLSDESRETYVDANKDGLFNIGDVVFGYVRISDFQPSGNPANLQVWGVFSEEIAAGSGGRDVIFKPTTVAGLTLKELLGNDARVGANSFAAMYDSPVGFTDMINAAPPTNPTSMQGYFDYIRTTGTLRIVGGFVDSNDFLYSENTRQGALQVGDPNGGIANAPFGPLSIASNFGAISITYNATDWLFNDVPTQNPLQLGGWGNAQGQIVISSGTTGGGAGALPNPDNWKNAGNDSSGNPYLQCNVGGVDQNCGFTDKNDFAVNAYKQLPEPGSLGLFSTALLGLAGFARRRKSS
jgi:hypothetical protein